MDLPLTDFVPFGRRVTTDPYATYARLRDQGGLLRTSYGVVVAHRYDDVRRIQSDHADFSMRVAAAMAGGLGDGTTGGGEAASTMSGTMLMADPPDHERLRRVVNRAFTPRSITALEPRIREICQELLAPLRAGEPFDVVADFAGPLPTIVIAELLGVPREDAADFRRWSEVVTGTDAAGAGARRPALLRRYGEELRAYLAAQIRRRKAAPTDDLIGRMVAANEDQLMTDEEVVAACVLLLVAGNETTMRLLTNMTLALGRHPDQLALLAEDPGRIPSAVEETLRYDSPVQMLFRGARRDVEYGGHVLPAGTPVFTLLGAANRDPAVFPEPDRFDVERSPDGHIAFGHGIHFCLGAALARGEARVAYEELLSVAPRFESRTPDDELEYPPFLLLRSPRKLVVHAV